MKILKKMRSITARKKKTKRAVAFDKAISVKEVDYIENHEDVWYCHSEYQEMKAANKLVVRKMMGHPDAQCEELGQESTRGLALHHPDLRRQREEIRVKSCLAVLEEQYMQAKTREWNAEAIARIYSLIAEPQVEMARQQAAKDERFVRRELVLAG